MAMTSLHAAVGIGIVKTIPNPWVSLPTAFLSHILVDLYPEWYPAISGVKKEDKFNIKAYGWKDYILIVSQILLLGVIGYYLIREKSWVMAAAVFLANLMDLWDFIWEKLFKQKFWFVHRGWFPFRRDFPWQGTGMRPLQNATLDAIFVLLLVFS